MSAAVQAHQRADVAQLIDRLCSHSDNNHANDRSLSDAAVSVSFLVDDDDRAAFEAAAEEYAADVHERARVQLLGPLAAFDFAGE